MQSIPSNPLRQNLPQLQLIRQLHAFAEKRGVQLYLVGGSVRDLLLNQSITDFDFALADDAIAFAKAFADKIGAAFVKLEEQPPTARIVIRETRLTLDFAGFSRRDFGGRSVPTGSDNQHDGIGSFLALDETGGEFD